MKLCRVTLRNTFRCGNTSAQFIRVIVQEFTLSKYLGLQEHGNVYLVGALANMVSFTIAMWKSNEHIMFSPPLSGHTSINYAQHNLVKKALLTASARWRIIFVSASSWLQGARRLVSCGRMQTTSNPLVETICLPLTKTASPCFHLFYLVMVVHTK